MARKRQLFFSGEDAHAYTIAPLGLRIVWKKKRRLRKICLSCQRLHLVVRESMRIMKDRQRIALERALSEDIKDRIGECARHPSMLRARPVHRTIARSTDDGGLDISCAQPYLIVTAVEQTCSHAGARRPQRF
jgi:hypothetical protein